MNLENFVLSFFEFVGNLDFNIFGTLLFLLLGIFWFVLVGWVWVDSGERTSNRQARIIYLLLVLVLNIPGLIIYLIVRPSETIEQIYWADLERRYLKYETAELGDCPECGSQLFPGYHFCANCGCDIKKKCPSCGVMISKTARYCAHCGAKITDTTHKEEEYPSIEIMEQQILATKEEAAETVESNRLRYKQGGSFVVKLGSSIISSWKNFFTNEEKVEEKEIVKKENTKKKKKKRRRKK
jgi:hypothetical protein